MNKIKILFYLINKTENQKNRLIDETFKYSIRSLILMSLFSLLLGWAIPISLYVSINQAVIAIQEKNK